MAKIARAARNETQKEIVKVFESLTGRNNLWTLWGDFVTMLAIAISNTVDLGNRDSRERTFTTISAKYTKAEMEAFAKIYALLARAYDEDYDQDLLGELYMALGLGNDAGGQFFTPYSVCKCMAALNWDDQAAQIEQKGWISVNDPAVGAGALLIAFASICREKNLNYQLHVLFTAQDVDYVTACMCYIQLSLLGCPGYVYVGDTISDPCTAVDKRGLIPAHPERCWFTPMFFSPAWCGRVLISHLEMMERSHGIESKPAQIEPIPETKNEQTNQENAQPDKENAQESIEIAQADTEIELLTDKNGQLMLF